MTITSKNFSSIASVVCLAVAVTIGGSSSSSTAMALAIPEEDYPELKLNEPIELEGKLIDLVTFYVNPVLEGVTNSNRMVCYASAPSTEIDEETNTTKVHYLDIKIEDSNPDLESEKDRELCSTFEDDDASEGLSFGGFGAPQDICYVTPTPTNETQHGLMLTVNGTNPSYIEEETTNTVVTVECYTEDLVVGEPTDPFDLYGYETIEWTLQLDNPDSFVFLECSAYSTTADTSSAFYLNQLQLSFVHGEVNPNLLNILGGMWYQCPGEEDVRAPQRQCHWYAFNYDASVTVQLEANSLQGETGVQVSCNTTEMDLLDFGNQTEEFTVESGDQHTIFADLPETISEGWVNCSLRGINQSFDGYSYDGATMNVVAYDESESKFVSLGGFFPQVPQRWISFKSSRLINMTHLVLNVQSEPYTEGLVNVTAGCNGFELELEPTPPSAADAAGTVEKAEENPEENPDIVPGGRLRRRA